MAKKKRGALVFVALLATRGAAVAQPDTNSANFILPACREYFSDDTNIQNPFRAGRCAGIIETLRFTGFRTCIPQETTNGQVGNVLLRYLDQHPQRLHENFKVLAVEALQRAWPCRN